MTSENEYAITVTRADESVTRIGPIPYLHVAEAMHRYFTGEARTHTAGAAEAHVEIAAYDPDAEHLPLVSCSTDAVLVAMEDPEQNPDGPFPDLWSRFRAQHGYEEAEKVWSTAVALIDQPADEDDGMVTVRVPRETAEVLAGIIDGHLEEYPCPVEDMWGVIEAVRQMDAERGAEMYREHRYRVNGGTVYDVVDRVEVETEFADSDTARAWVNKHGKSAPGEK
ncbi:hypothetical protein [Streptomyces sp. MH60]|uniref:hypothetical protein n=1 Tax=Streptomyces sp. MH60 TaxID=1940758 RepID=UPI000CED928E|nr:hypothetical protein [Streptomyces sp. MH60]PPS89417.1 hypothetical protein BZZ08_01563 [Streptomyces sp. MH60]